MGKKHKTALRVPEVSVRWPDDGQTGPKHVAIKIKTTKYNIIVFDSN